MKNVKLERRHLETDVLIIGGGTAGCYAAIKLGAQKDLRVLVVEKANIERGRLRRVCTQRCRGHHPR